MGLIIHSALPPNGAISKTKTTRPRRDKKMPRPRTGCAVAYLLLIIIYLFYEKTKRRKCAAAKPYAFGH